eukprot:5324968-Karenia_brevis.AAC.1
MPRKIPDVLISCRGAHRRSDHGLQGSDRAFNSDRSVARHVLSSRSLRAMELRGDTCVLTWVALAVEQPASLRRRCHILQRNF